MTGLEAITAQATAFTAVAALLVGWLTVRLAGSCARAPWRLRWWEALAPAVAIGLLALVAARYGVALVPLAVLGSAAAIIDIIELRLPDVLTTALLVATTALTLLSEPLAAVLLVVAGAGVVAVGLRLLAGGAFGWGDAKLLPSLGLVLVPAGAVLHALVVSLVIIGVHAGVRAARRVPGGIAYGPALVIATITVTAF